MKLLVNKPTGGQEVIEVGQGGNYFDPDRVIWDERVDGTLPAITLGGMIRTTAMSFPALAFDQATMDASTASAMPSVNDYVVALDNFFDAKARERQYDNRITCSLRAGYPGVFHAEGLAFATWMDGCYALSNTILAQVQEEEIPQPTIAEFMAMLPTLTWP